jgi:hypothetical protein
MEWESDAGCAALGGRMGRLKAGLAGGAAMVAVCVAGNCVFRWLHVGEDWRWVVAWLGLVANFGVGAFVFYKSQ